MGGDKASGWQDGLSETLTKHLRSGGRFGSSESQSAMDTDKELSSRGTQSLTALCFRIDFMNSTFNLSSTCASQSGIGAL
jgi:hypothetical protein